MTVLDPAGAGSALGTTGLLETAGLTVTLPTDQGPITPVRDVSFHVGAGETVGLVGESGCGKSTLGRAVCGLVEPSGGSVRFGGQEITGLRGRELRRLRRDLQMVFQDPRGSLDPRMTVEQLVAEPLRIHGLGGRRQRRSRALEMLDRVGLGASFAGRRPGELSGGQQQRVGIARALVTGPRLVVLDEPVSALDVSVQAQVVNLLQDLQAELGVGYLFIAHNLAVVRHISTRVMVMYLGDVVEEGPAGALFDDPRHPYTMGLIASVLRPALDSAEQLDAVEHLAAGEVPSVLNPPPGCRYHTRCPFAAARCQAETPALADTGDRPGHRVACHRWREIRAAGVPDDAPRRFPAPADPAADTRAEQKADPKGEAS